MEHYALLASKAGWIDYARQQVMEMEQEKTGIFKGLGRAVAQRLKELKDEADCRT